VIPRFPSEQKSNCPISIKTGSVRHDALIAKPARLAEQQTVILAAAKGVAEQVWKAPCKYPCRIAGLSPSEARNRSPYVRHNVERLEGRRQQTLDLRLV
jgi:hypothetical protein